MNSINRISRMANITQRCILLLAACAIVSGCATVQPVTRVNIANGIDMALLLPEKNLSATQKIQAQYHYQQTQQQHTLIMQVQASPQTIVMAGLTPTGTRLFSLSFNGQSIESWKSPLFTAPFDGSYVLADFELVTLDITALRKALPTGVTLTETALAEATRTNTHRTRSLYNAQGNAVIRIDYHDTQTRYCHLERDYCLQIETLP